MCFLSLPLLIAIVPLNKLIIIEMVIIIPWPYPLLCHKPIKETHQGERVSPHRIIIHLPGLKVIRNILQWLWIFLDCLAAHLLGPKAIRNRLQLLWIFFNGFFTHDCVLRRSGVKRNSIEVKWSNNPLGHNIYRAWIHVYCSITHLLHFKMIGDKSQHVSVVGQCLIAHLLSFQAVRDMLQGVWFPAHCLNAHLLHFKMVADKSQPVWITSHCIVIHFFDSLEYISAYGRRQRTSRRWYNNMHF